MFIDVMSGFMLLRLRICLFMFEIISRLLDDSRLMVC